MDKWLTRQTVDLARQQQGSPHIGQPIGEGASNGLVWEVTVLRDGKPADLAGGAVHVDIIRPDAVRVTIAGSIAGNVATATLDDDSCAIPGRITGVMWATQGSGEMVPIAWCEWSIYRTGKGLEIVDTPTVPDINTLLAELDNIRAIEAAHAAAEAARVSAENDRAAAEEYRRSSLGGLSFAINPDDGGLDITYNPDAANAAT